MRFLHVLRPLWTKQALRQIPEPIINLTRNHPLECIGSPDPSPIRGRIRIREQPNSSVGGACKSANWHVEFYAQVDEKTYITLTKIIHDLMVSEGAADLALTLHCT